MIDRQYVCRGEELPEGASRVVAFAGRPIAVYRLSGILYAIDDVCPHMGASLSAGPVEDGTVTCPWHYWRFRLADGACPDNPRIAVGCYAVAEEGGRVFVGTRPKD